MLFNPSRDDVRRFFVETWRKRREGVTLEPMEAIAAQLVEAHPEYHDLLVSADEAVAAEFSPDSGKMNPFLHLSLHLAVAEQLSIDQPPGIRGAYEAVLARTGDVHEALHAVLDALGETIWRAQRDGAPMDALDYVERVRRRAGAPA